MRRAQGFTLVELLIALALTGIVTLLILSGTRFAAVGLDRTAAAAERLETRRNLDALLSRELASAVVLPLLPNEAPLEGTPQSVQFLSLAEDAGAGLFRTTIAVEGAGAARALVLKRQGIDAAGAPARTLLVPRLGGFAIAYFGATDRMGSAPAWHDRWERLPYLPMLVRITLDGAGLVPRPPLVVRLWTAP